MSYDLYHYMNRDLLNSKQNMKIHNEFLFHFYTSFKYVDH